MNHLPVGVMHMEKFKSRADTGDAASRGGHDARRSMAKGDSQPNHRSNRNIHRAFNHDAVGTDINHFAREAQSAPQHADGNSLVDVKTLRLSACQTR